MVTTAVRLKLAVDGDLITGAFSFVKLITMQHA